MEAEVVALYAAFPMDRRLRLYTLVRADPTFPFKDDYDESPAGGYFEHILLDVEAAIVPLDDIINILCNSEGYNAEQRQALFQGFRRAIAGAAAPAAPAPAAGVIPAAVGGAGGPSPTAFPPMHAAPRKGRKSRKGRKNRTTRKR